MMAPHTSAGGTGPSHGSSVTLADQVHMSGRKAASVMRLRMNSTPRPSMMRAKRIVSSCTRCADPSMWRTLSQWAM